MPKGNFIRNEAFTLVELIIVLVILSILAGIAIPEYMAAKTTSKAAQCGAGIRSIETAKNLWRKDYPGQEIISNSFANLYFPGNTFPQDPWGKGFINAFTVTQITSHPNNNNPQYEPPKNCSPTNGYNDNSQLSK